MGKKKKFDALRHETRTQRLLHEHLSSRSRELLEEFDVAAQGFEHHQDEPAKVRYLLAKRKLVNRLRTLEERCAAYESKVSGLTLQLSDYDRRERLRIQPSPRP